MKNQTHYTCLQLLTNAFLCTIAQAVYQAETGEECYEYQWEDNIFLANNGSGDNTVICFIVEEVVGAAFEHESPESPYQDETTGYNPENFLLEMPQPLKEMVVKECFPYMLLDLDGATTPVCTTVLWSKNGSLFTDGNALTVWEDLLKATPDILAAHFDLSKAQLKVVRDILAIKMNHPRTTVVLDNEVAGLLKSISGNEEGYELCRDTLKTINLEIDH